MRVCACLVLASSLATARTISFGLTAGAPLSDLVSAAPGRVATTDRYTFGPALEAGLPHGFAVDAEFLYKRLELGVTQGSARATVGRWELPLLLRYRFSGLRGALWARPFVHAGAAFNRVMGAGGASVAELRHRGTKGAVLGGGVESKLGAIRLAPELRVTRWGDRNFGVRDSSLRSNLTQVEVLLGVRF
jgi:hypothetical protein